MVNKPGEFTEHLADKEPDVALLLKSYDETIADLEGFFQQCRENYDDRRNHWAGKSRDLRKHGADAFPWDGAADMEAHVIDERVNAYIALFMTALNRANIRAYPTEASDIRRAKVTSSFLKWMMTNYIPNFKRQMELAANYLLERGVMITYVGWERSDKTYLERIDLEQIAEVAPRLAAGIADGTSDEQMEAMIMSAFKGVNKKRAQSAIRELRTKGFAEIPTTKRLVDRPCAKTLSPDGDFFFPSYVTDPQEAPYCFWRVYMTPQQLINKISSEGWSEEWVDYVIKHCRGVNVSSFENDEYGRRAVRLTGNHSDMEDLIEVIYGYQRLVDEKDNSEGIYCTIFNRQSAGRKNGDQPLYAKFELMNGYENYPVVVTRLNEASKRLYDVMSMAELLRGIQNQVKVERDGRIDRNSLATLPWIEAPTGTTVLDIGPGKMVQTRRGSELRYGPIPQFNPGSVEMEITMLRTADRNVGLDSEDPLSPAKQQYFIDKFLQHAEAVIKMAFKAFQRFGPDSVFFRVTGVADPQEFSKGNPEEDFDIMIGYDVLNNDPEIMEAKLQALASLMQFDRNGKIDPDAMIEVMASAIDPVMADALIQSTEEGQSRVMKDVTDDLAKISASIEMPARPNGAQVALQMIEQYAAQPDVSARLQNDKPFAERLQKYQSQYVFMLKQAENAQIGKIGTSPASMGTVNTQNAN